MQNKKILINCFSILFLCIFGCSRYEIEGKSPKEIYDHYIPILTNLETSKSELIKTIEEVELVYKMFPNEPMIKKLRSQSLSRLSDMYLRQKSIEDAMKYANLALELDRKNIEAYEVLSSAYWVEGDIDASFNQSKKILRLDPNNYYAAGNIGYGSCFNNRHEDSVKFSLLALKLFPKNPKYEEDKRRVLELKYCVGYSYYFLGNKKMSEKYLAEFLAEAENFETFDPNFPAIYDSGKRILKRIQGIGIE